MEPGDGSATHPAPQELIKENGASDTRSGANEDEGDYCRICRGEDTKEQPLFYPCKCSGSIKFVHQDCLMEWLSHSQKKYCELCKTPFRFTKLYDRRMPKTLPMPLFLRQLAYHGVRTLVRWTRFVMVGLVWLGWLPWSIRQVWRGLFWLADGSWVALNELEGSVALAPSEQFLNETSSSPNSVTLFNISDTTMKDALPQVVAPISRFLGLSSPDFLLVKIVKAFYPNFFRWTSQFLSAATSGNVTIPGTYVPSKGDRPPSLLSNAAYLSNATSYTTINNALIDILEGQLTCLLVVTAFILVFLIREWVINQQPAANMPNPDRVEDAVLPPPVENGRPGQMERHHRRGIRDAAEQRENGPVIGNAPRLEGLRPIGAQRRRRPLMVEDHDAGAAQVHAPQLESPAAESTASPVGGFDEGILIRPNGLDIQENSRSGLETRPALPARNAFNEAASIRRTIEEGSPTREGQIWSRTKIFRDLWTRAQGDPATVLRLIREDDRGEELGWVIELMEKLQKGGSSEQSTTLPNSENLLDGAREGDSPRLQESLVQAIIEDSDEDIPASSSAKSDELRSDVLRTTGDAEIDEVKDMQPLEQSEDFALPHPSANPVQPMNTPPTMASTPEPLDIVGSNPELDPAQADTDQSPPETLSSPQGNSDASASAPAPDSADRRSSEATADFYHEESLEITESNEVRVVHDSLLEPVLDWFWRTDEYVPGPEDTPNQDDEQIVQDLDTKAPFVPVHQDAADVARENGENEDEPDDLEQVGRPNQFGIDLNNPEGIDEAEDIDGILELIGMQGPLTGMVQNVIFSEFLITLTIAASVWLPYIWGKIALLVLANPVAMLKAPLYLVSGVVDTIVDIMIFVCSLLVYAVTFAFSWPVKLIGHFFPKVGSTITSTVFNNASLSMARGSGTRLERAIFGTVFNLKPDLPTFSVLSHQALRIFEQRLAVGANLSARTLAFVFYGLPIWLHDRVYGLQTLDFSVFSIISTAFRNLRVTMTGGYAYIIKSGRNLSFDLGHLPPLDTRSLDYSLARWSTKDKILAIILGYSFFTLMGFLYLKICRYVVGLKDGEKVDGVIADGLNQAGGVMKVVLIIGIEMIVFPLYCGLLLDVALIPLFAGVHLRSRVDFLMEAPSTALFVHWFIGTCYMFHFALFVSMCRKIMRKGVLYFIRDPDDPTFHPVRDVLERPIATQLSKIAFSALVYGGLVIMCLGGVIFALREVDGILPIQWATGEPKMELPIDLIFFNFALPFLIRKAEPSSKLNAIYEWWFRRCARTLRLTHFLFGEKKEDEEGVHVRRTWSAVLHWKKGNFLTPVIGEDRRLLAEDREIDAYFLRNGRFVRAPASDSVRIPKGERVFLEVDENNERVDRLPDPNDGPHGKTNKNFTKVYIPPMFRARIAFFVFAIWVFAAITGVIMTILPLITGRRALTWFSQSKLPPNDLYAFTAGLYICSGVVYTVAYYRVWRNWLLISIVRYFGNPRQMLSKLQSTTAYIVGLAYMTVAFGVVLPFAFSLVAELYFLVPFYTHLISPLTSDASPATIQNSASIPPTIHILQTWTLGLFYLRLSLRLATAHSLRDTRPALAVRSILRNGVLHPDVRLATRAFILPSLIMSILLLCIPVGLGKVVNSLLMVKQPELESKVYRYAYPGLLAGTLLFYCAARLKKQVSAWRIRIRDDVYLIGERLHNFGEAKRKASRSSIKGKQRGGSVPERVDVR